MFRLATLKQLIQKLFKKYNLEQDIHFDVWICGFDENEIIRKDEPFVCAHFYGYKSPKEASDIFKWLEFEVEDYEFEIVENPPEYHLFVKLVDIDNSPK